MSTEILQRTRLTIKSRTLNKILALILSIVYGLFIVLSLQIQFSLGSGDIDSLLHFFDEAGNDISTVSLSGDYVFRIAVFYITQYFDIETLVVLNTMAFLIAYLIFYLYSVNIRSQAYLIYILPLFFMVFFTPNVQVLFSSGIRSGIAFTVLMFALSNYKGLTRYALFLISSAIHLSMLPILALYVFFYILNNRMIKTPFIVSLFLLFMGTFIIAFGGTKVHFVDVDSASISYNLLIFYAALLIIFINKKAIKDLYGFLSVGLIFIYICGLFIDASYIRYVGNSILLYLFFLIKNGEKGTIEVFTVGYSPFFILTLLYSITNWI
ncbi:MAG: hypothetical protein VW947_03005 [Gammaproteobacteria bacterium]|jgi:hypothetical protein